ncbi:hypothetical protein Dimus_026119 [Dionaea muscipula]
MQSAPRLPLLHLSSRTRGKLLFKCSKVPFSFIQTRPDQKRAPKSMITKSFFAFPPLKAKAKAITLNPAQSIPQQFPLFIPFYAATVETHTHTLFSFFFAISMHVCAVCP